MEDTNKLLDKCRDVCGVKSDNQLSTCLGVSRQAVSEWRHGRRHPDPVACAKIADTLGIPVARVLGIVGEARALSGAEKQVWRRLAMTAVIAFATLAMMLPATASAVGSRAAQTIHYAHSAMRQICRIFALRPRIWATA